MRRGVYQVLEIAEKDEDIRVVIITGAERSQLATIYKKL